MFTTYSDTPYSDTPTLGVSLAKYGVVSVQERCARGRGFDGLFPIQAACFEPAVAGRDVSIGVLLTVGGRRGGRQEVGRWLELPNFW